eukprot:gnl/TRDRNA2_/TRDRNA2_94365_c0_seq1.p1 gnl/TRDRNA2_/TRDRNA2_94365_c0~~gnl/TRDRNA2_/TRDRNA2_94365_c0_seq1.p1  ORF type:complete len:252 (+),score=37.20 gnl/TRDRNA2_/TRDRNA2_94365_c0_seq1:73-828(+)
MDTCTTAQAHTSEGEYAKELSLATNAQVEALGPGLVVIRGALSPDAQCRLATYALEIGGGKQGGFWINDDSGRRLNAGPARGRIYKALQHYRDFEFIRSLCLELVDTARHAAPKLPLMDVTHMLLLYYTGTDGMGWHRDSDPNDGDNDHPIVSVSVGNSCEFGYKPLLQSEHAVMIESGDVLIWGGPQRMLEHCVRSVQPGSAPAHLRATQLGDARLNFTFRSAPNILGEEERYGSGFWVDPSTGADELTS